MPFFIGKILRLTHRDLSLINRFIIDLLMVYYLQNNKLFIEIILSIDIGQLALSQ